ncbi:MAG: hypothetical protein WC879_06450 [Melioribacteraceae bacterium]
MKLNMTEDELNLHILLSSIPLKELDDNKMPINSASGCIIDYCNKSFILTVSHATKNFGKWAIEIAYEPSKGTQLYFIGQMNFLIEATLGSSIVKDVDFSYAIVPENIQPIYQQFDTTGKIIDQFPRTKNQIDFNVNPSTEKKYGFSGQTKLSLENSYLFGEIRLITDLKYLEERDGFYVFKLPFKHQGHEYYQGCSGAPIIDNEGNIVALVTSGDEDTDTIMGINIKKYKVALDIACNNIS